MKRTLTMLSLLGGLSLLLLVPSTVKADELVFDSGPINTIDAKIDATQVVSNLFTVSSATTLTGAQFGLVIYPSTAASSVDWAIGTSAFGTDIGSGTASISSLVKSPVMLVGVVPIYEATIAIDGTVDPGTTYWFSLTNAVIASGFPYTTLSNFTLTDKVKSGTSIYSSGTDSFQLYGTAVPEPGSLALLAGMGITGAGLLTRRK